MVPEYTGVNPKVIYREALFMGRKIQEKEIEIILKQQEIIYKLLFLWNKCPYLRMFMKLKKGAKMDGFKEGYLDFKYICSQNYISLRYIEHILNYDKNTDNYKKGAVVAIKEVYGPIDFDGTNCRCDSCRR